ncbi:MAG: uncharacterized protein QOI66_4438 [Myxococcales bacterium]|jgi:hypothetical protein|nr:uncharacterized protein [Myxococcales bacterium]
MSDDASQTTSSDNASLATVAAQILNAIGHADSGPATTRPPAAENFLRCTRDQLLGFAKSLGLAGISKLSKTDLAARLQVAFAGFTAKSDGVTNGGPKRVDGAGAAADTRANDSADQTGFPPKYDLGPDAEEAQMPRHIPWGYGQDRVTAMVVDPDRLFVYWEVTDDALARGRKELGKGGAGAWLNLRVYDVTGRLFDGTNAHSYFDHKIERGDRQWFFDINKPTSSACVEVGLRSTEGFFVKLARSGRVEFPRREPVGGGHTEWLTVTNAGGAMNGSVPGTVPAPPARAAGSPGWDDSAVQAAAPHGAGQGDDGGGEMEAVLIGGAEHQTERRWEWREGEHGAWQTELAAISWTEPVIRSTWEAGPFTYPVESPVFTEERQVSGGQLNYRTENGRVHITYGPWQVVIRGLGARAERRVLATWQVTHSWSTLISSETTPTQWQQLAPGSSEWLALGGSERHWLMGSELRLGGASELFLLGASELRLLGASEKQFIGASEYRFRGASERVAAGASEYLYRGASERVLGSSEQRLAYPVTPGGDNGEQR